MTLSVVASSLILALHSPTVDAQSVRTNQVDLVSTTFSPPDITVLKGSQVTWTMKDTGTDHTVTDDAGPTTATGGAWNLHEFGPATGQPTIDKFSVTFPNVGVIKYHCDVHASMHGTIHVVAQFDTPAAGVDVTATDANQFVPADVKVNQSQSVTWTNGGSNKHSVTFESASVGDLGDLEAGKKLNHTFTAPGTYRYRCKYHSTSFESGMVGAVAVGGNATTPTLIQILHPAEGDTVNGTINVTGTVKRGLGQPPVTSVQVALDGGNYSVADGIDNWTFLWSTMNTTNGPHLLTARAMVSATPAGSASVNLTVNNTRGGIVTTEKKKSGIPGFGPSLVVIALVTVAALVRRRR